MERISGSMCAKSGRARPMAGKARSIRQRSRMRSIKACARPGFSVAMYACIVSRSRSAGAAKESRLTQRRLFDLLARGRNGARPRRQESSHRDQPPRRLRGGRPQAVQSRGPVVAGARPQDTTNPSALPACLQALSCKSHASTMRQRAGGSSTATSAPTSYRTEGSVIARSCKPPSRSIR